MTNPPTWPLALTVREQGDANHYAILHRNDWLAALHINGELTVSAQTDLVRVMAAAPVLLDALELAVEALYKAFDYVPAGHENAACRGNLVPTLQNARAAIRLAGNTESVRNYFDGRARERKADMGFPMSTLADADEDAQALWERDKD